MIPPPPPQEATDIFSISDQVLADRLQFIEEIGFGNWGSVWLCRPKPDPPSTSGAPPRPNDNKIAVKLVHRSKTSTTAARVRSLWNEMKVVRSFKHEPHPSIIPFYSFIITPSYALITMAHHPRLVPVEVSERHAKEWFRSLLSGVDFLHKRGVVHNDIKPANILLSSENVPVLVDFGFAERYDTTIATAFHSNLSYGTPEYLSPERARGMPHDTRKSDVWSLGVTFFEILVGRTPFEYAEGEQFSTKEDLEQYWARTLKGKWVGRWKMSAGGERMLRRMILPNADLRCTAGEAMEDPYWGMEVEREKEGRAHKKAASVAHAASPSIAALDASEISRLIDASIPWSPRSNASMSSSNTHSSKEKKPAKIPVAVDKENLASPPGLTQQASATMKEKRTSKRIAVESKHARSHSQPKLQATDSPKPRTKANDTPGAPRLPSLLSALSPIPQIRIAPTPINTPDASLVLPPSLTRPSSQAHERAQQQPVSAFSSPTNTNASTSESSCGGGGGATSKPGPGKKPLGPRQSPASSLNQKRADALRKLEGEVDTPPAVPEKDASVRSRRSVLRERENVREGKEKESKEKDKRRRSRVFGVDLTGLSRNGNGTKEESKPAVFSAAPITTTTTKRKVVPAAVKKDKENGGVSVSRRTTTTSKSASSKANATKTTTTTTKPAPPTKPTSPSPASPASPATPASGEIKQDSVRDRMREWERERARLRELALRVESEVEPEPETERESEAERAEAHLARVEAARREAVQEEKRRRVQEMMRGLEEARAREVERVREVEKEVEKEVVEGVREREKRRFGAGGQGGGHGHGPPQIMVVQEPEQEVESALPTPLSPLMEESFESRFLDEFTRSGNESSLSLLKQSLKMSIDGAVRLYKSSTALALGRSTNGSELNVPTPDNDEDGAESRRSVSVRASWENDALVREVRNEQLAQESQLDRMTIWIRSVEKVVEDARQNFNASTTAGPLPPLPIAPAVRGPKPKEDTSSSELNKSQRSSNTRVPRKILAANQIFVNEYESGTAGGSPLASSFDQSQSQPSTSFALSARERSFLVNDTLPTIPSEDERSRADVPQHQSSPARARRATVVTRSPEPKPKPEKRRSAEDETTASPSKRREKSRSQNDLGRAITPITQLEFEIERLSKPTPTVTPRLSAVVDKSLFVSNTPSTPVLSEFDDSVIMKRSLRYDDLTSSPLRVDPYPARPQSQLGPILDTPAKKHVESVYDRFLMSTTGVKRNGRGYQSDNFGPASHTVQPKATKTFFTTRKPMPPPVSSEDWRELSSDEFGTLHSPRVIPNSGTAGKSDGVSKFRSALRTIVNGKR